MKNIARLPVGNGNGVTGRSARAPCESGHRTIETYALLGAIALGLATTGSEAASERYRVLVLDVPAGSSVAAINDRGWVAGWAKNPWVWIPGAGVQSFDPFPGASPNALSLVGAINDSGAVVGYSVDGEFSGAWIWTPEHGARSLDRQWAPPDPAPRRSGAHDISDRGEAVGFVGGFGVGAPTYSFRWTEAGGLSQFSVENRASPYEAGVAINERGDVVVKSIRGLYLAQGAGSVVTLGLSSDDAYDINDAATVVGTNITTNRAWVWTPDGGKQPIGLVAGGGEARDAYGVNEAGVIVGRSSVGTGYVWTEEGGAIALESLIDPVDPEFGRLGVASAMGINNSGVIVANGTLAGVSRAVVLIPVPEVSTTALLAAGLLALFSTSWGRARRSGRI